MLPGLPLILLLSVPHTATLPDTPAGRKLSDFLAVFNSGSRVGMRRFIRDNMDLPPDKPELVDATTDQQMLTFAQSGGFTVREVQRSESAMVRVLAQSKLLGSWMQVSLFVSAKPPEYRIAVPPYKMEGLGMGDCDAPPEFVDQRPLSDAVLRERLDRSLRDLTRSGGFSGTVTVARKGRVIYGGAFGWASEAWNRPNRIDTRFNLASITKVFTAVAVAQLVQAGKLRLSETVGEVLPGYANSEVASQVTIAQLLSHTSGLIGSREEVEQHPGSPTDRTVQQMVKPILHEPLSFPPGQEFQYSNAGFELLGLIVEKASGRNYFEYIRSHVFRPAGMRDTDFLELDRDPPNVATGYQDEPAGERRSNIFDLSVIGSPAGGAYSTGPDLVRFTDALTSGRLVSRKLLEQFWTGVTENADRHTEYGMGFQASHFNGFRELWHGGGWKGVTDEYRFIPDLGVTIAVLSNFDDDPGSIASKIQEWLTQGHGRPDPPDPAPAILVSAAAPATDTMGTPVPIQVTVSNRGGTAHGSIIDVEVHDSSGAKVWQRFTSGQKLTPGQRSFAYRWTPASPGRYTVDVGIFSDRWATKYVFRSGLLTVVARE